MAIIGDPPIDDKELCKLLRESAERVSTAPGHYHPTLPAHVQIGPIRYRVERHFEAIHKASKDAKEPDLMGSISYQDQLISIAPGLGPDQEADTLLHEVVHALIVNGGLEEFKATDEGLVCGLTNALLDCLRRNPDLVRFLTEVER